MQYIEWDEQHGDPRPKPGSRYYRATKVRAFSFDQRDKNKHNIISQVKLEQDLTLKSKEEEQDGGPRAARKGAPQSQQDRSQES